MKNRLFTSQSVMKGVCLLLMMTGSGMNRSQAQSTVVLTSGQTWTVPAGLTTATFYIWGGGGAGAGSNSAPNCYTNGGGGGGGACASAVVTTLSAGQVYTFSGGLGGVANSSTGVPGGNGQTATLTGPAGTWTAAGGLGAAGTSTSASVNNAGGAGGSTGTGPGVTVRSGGAGSSAANGGLLCLSTRRSGSGGGGGGSTGIGSAAAASCSGSGGAGGTGTFPGGTGGYNTACGVSSGNGNGVAGAVYGGGGSGCYNWSGSARPGGAGGDGRVVITYTLACSGTPAPGNTISSINPVCSGTGITLSLQNTISLSGITYQWQSSTNGSSYSPISGATSSTYSTTASSSLYYRCVVSCSGGGSGTSNPLLVNLISSAMPQDFSSATFPPCLWAVSNSTYTLRSTASAFGAGNGSVKFDFYNATNGTVLDLTPATFSAVPAGSTLTFDFAYSAYDDLFDGCNYNVDNLRIRYSTNGGSTYSQLIRYDGGTSPELNPLGTCGTSAFTPTAGQWSSKTIVLPAGTNRIQFRAVSDFGNNLYVDNINVNIPPACSGIPSPGNTIASTNNQCLGTSVALSLANTFATGLGFQWQSSPNNTTYTAVNGATQSQYAFSPNASAYYRCLVTCANSGLSSVSNPLLLNVLPCIEMPDNVTVSTCSGTFYDSGGSSGNYGTGENLVTTICPANAGSSIKAVFTSFSVTSGFDDLYIHNGATVSSPLINSGNGTSFWGFPAGGFWGTSSPGGAAGILSTDASGCLTFEFMSGSLLNSSGWAATISCEAPCTGTPNAGTTTVSAGSPFCASNTFTLSVPGVSTGIGLTYQWQSSPDNNNWSTVSGATGTSYTTSQSASTWYRCLVSCANSGQSVTSAGLQVLTNANFMSCYCASIPTSPIDEEIYKITLNGAQTPAAYADGAGCSNTAPGPGSILNRYSNFLNQQPLANLMMGVPASFSISENECNGSPFYAFGTAVWIDYNHNGSFADAGEKVFVESATATGPRTIAGAITVPTSALSGNTAMRIIAAEGFSGSSLTPCLAYTYGETEDWKVNIVPPNATSNSPVCAHDTLRLFAPTAGTSFSWTTTASNGFASSLQNPVIPAATPADNGTYTVLVNTGSGTYTASVTVDVNALPAVSASSDPAFCEGTQDLNLFSTAPAAVSYTWSGPGGYSSVNSNPVLTNTTSGMSGLYTVEVTDVNGCSNASTTSVTIHALPPVDIVVIGSMNVCSGQTTSDLQALGADWTGGSAGYSWNTSETSDLITVSTAGIYQVTGTDGNGCENSYSVIITESTPPAAPDVTPSATQNLCSGDGGLNYSTISLEVTNYSSDLLWSTGENTQAISINYPDVFFAIYTDAAGCYAVSNIVTVNGLLASESPTDITSNIPANTLCGGTQVTLTVNDGSLGDQAGWVWYESACGGTPAGTGNPLVVTPSGTGSHFYYARAEGYCNITACAPIEIIVKEESVGATSLLAAPAVICEGDETEIYVSGGYLGTGAHWALYENNCGSVSQQTSVAPLFTIAPQSPGLHTYFIRAEGDCNTTLCRSIVIDVKDSSSQAVSVAASSSVICEGDHTLLSVNGGHLGRGAVWSWYENTCGGGLPLQSSTSPAIAVSPLSGTHTYFVRAEGDCNNTQCLSVSVTVKDSSHAPVLALAFPSVLCEGDATTLSVSGGQLGDGGNWAVYENNCGSGTALQRGVSPFFTIVPQSPGLHTYYIRAEGDCNNTICRSVTVDVKDSSVQASSVIASAPVICEGSQTVLSITGGHLGRGGVWNWYENGCGSGAPLQSSASTSLTVMPLSPGIHTFYARAQGDCNTTQCRSVSITVKDSSHAPLSATASSTIICSGDITTLTVNGGYLGSGANWKWFAGSCGGSLVGIGNSINVTPAASITYFARAEGDCNTTACVSTTVTVRTPSVSPVSVITSVSQVCLGGSVTLSVSGGSLGTGAVWKWYEDLCGGGPVIGTGSTITVNPGSTGVHNYYVRAEGPCNTTGCAGASVSVAISSVAATGATTNVVANSICLGNTVTLSVNGGSLGTGASWKWYAGGCASGASIATGATITVTPAATTTYYVRAEGLCNNTGCVSVTVVVNTGSPSGPPPTITSAPNGICSGNGSTIACNSVSGATYYSWSAPAGTTFNGGNPSPYITTSNNVQVTFGSLPAGVSGYDICVFAGNGCGTTATKCRYIRGRVTQPQLISGLSNPCPNTSSVYSITSQPGADSYTWTVTGAATINGTGTSVTTTGTSVTLNFLSAWTSGTLNVYASMNCGYNSPVRSINIVSTPPVPGVISGSSVVCPLQTSSFSIAPVAGATGYIWSTSVAGSTVTPGGTNVSIAFGSSIPAGSTVSVIATGVCGNSLARVKSVGTGVANAPGTISGPDIGQCSQSGVSYSILPVSGATSYFWTVSSGASISGPANLSAVSVDFGGSFSAVTLSVIAVNGCGISVPQSLVINGAPAQPGIITGDQAVCFETVHHYNTPGSAGATSYNWTAPLGTIIFGAPVVTSEIDVLWGLSGGNITVNAENTCGISSNRDLPVSVVCRQSQVIAEEKDISVFPNPTTGHTTLKFDSENAGTRKINVLDAVGRSVQRQSMQVTEGMNLHDLDLSSLAKGIYLIRVESQEGILSIQKVTVE